MAVGAHENRVIIYALKGRETLKSEVQEPGGLNAANFIPILEVRSFVS